MSWRKALGSSVRELRFVFCQSTDRSSGLRNFVAKNYWDLKNQNPSLPLIVRECEDADPYVIARYQYGVERKALTSNLSESEIEKVLQELVAQSKKINTSV